MVLTSQGRLRVRTLTLTGFEHRTEIANWVNVAALILTVFLLLSFAVLPVKWTHRHYLSICLALGVACIEVGLTSLFIPSRLLLRCPACVSSTPRGQTRTVPQCHHAK